MKRQQSFFLRNSWFISALIILISVIIAYFVYGPDSIVTSLAAVALGFFFPFMVNFLGITSTARLQQQRKLISGEPVLELPSNLEDGDHNNSWEHQESEKPSMFFGMERYVLVWSVMTAVLIFVLPILL